MLNPHRKLVFSYQCRACPGEKPTHLTLDKTYFIFLHIIESPVERPLAQVDRVPVPTRPWLERVKLVLGVGVVPTLLQLRRGQDPGLRTFVPVELKV